MERVVTKIILSQKNDFNKTLTFFKQDKNIADI